MEKRAGTIVNLFMLGFYSCLIGYFLFFVLGFVFAMFLFGSNATLFQVFFLTPLIGFGLSVFFVVVGFIINIFGDIL